MSATPFSNDGDPKLRIHPELYRRFLLGKLAEEERAALEKRIFVEDALFEEMCAVEDELVEEAARGELDNADQQRLAALPNIAPRLSFARTLAHTADHGIAPPHVAKPGRRWPALSGWAAAAAIAMTVGLALVVGSMVESPAPEDTGTASFFLPRSTLRSSAEQLALGPEIERVRLVLEIDADSAERVWRAVLRDREGNESFRWNALSAQPLDLGLAVTIELPAEIVVDETYRLELSAVGEPELAEYSFTIARP